MTHPNHQTNGASLEDCHTNFFALTDLCGIKWRKLLYTESTYFADPLDDPVLASFSKCLAADILCVWRRVQAPRPPPISAPPTSANAFLSALDPMQAALGGGFPQHRQAPPPQLLPPPPPPPPDPALSLHSNKELWIFWYGEEPDLSGLVAPDLLLSEGEQGTWESSLSYECRTLLFKALHNLIERCLLSRDFVRLGKWFVRPYDSSEKILGKSTNFSFSFAFFVHGESTVCASLDVRQHPPVRCLARQHLLAAQASTGGTHVILAPFGLSGVLTGQGFKAMDSQTHRLLDDWRQFYPISTKYLGREANDGIPLPPAVEVIVGGVKLKYPSCYVLVTDMDEPSLVGAASSPGLKGVQLSATGGSIIKGSPPGAPSAGVPLSPSRCSPPRDSSISGKIPGQRGSSPGPAMQLLADPALALVDRSREALDLPERVWHDSSLGSHQQQHQATDSSLPPPNCSEHDTPGHWDFVDPTRKVSCSCAKCRKSRKSAAGLLLNSSKGDKVEKSRWWRSGGALTPFHRRSGDTDWLAGEAEAAPATRVAGPLTPSGGPPSYRGNQAMTPGLQHGAMGDIMPVPSVGSPPSAAPSPLLNPHSQPASVTPADPTMPTLSPHPPSSNQPGGGQPATPLESQDKVTPAATPSDMNGPKSVSSVSNQVFSPYPTTSSVEPSKAVDSQGPASASSATAHTPALPTATATNTYFLKRPVLASKDYETILMEEDQPSELLYDYSTLNAWLNHPVKRFKPAETRAADNSSHPSHQLQQPNNMQQQQQQHTQMETQAPGSPSGRVPCMEIKQEPGTQGGVPSEDGKSMGAAAANNNGALNKAIAGDLYTSQGLQASYSDLDQIFDNSDDTSSDETPQVPTPPGSNRPASLPEELGTTLVKPPRGSGGSSGAGSVAGAMGCGTGILRPEELSKMFPTPPSLEHHPIASPCGQQETTLGEVSEAALVPRFKQEIYPNMGSPQEENIEDWSFVFKPPLICKMVGSSKYAPLTNLPSQNLPPVTLPPHCVYKPSWQYPMQMQEKSNSSQSHSSSTPMPSGQSGPGSHRPPSRPVTGLSPISPAAAMAASASSMGHYGHPDMHHHRVGPPLPPPYELPSPASNASSYLNKNINSVEAGPISATVAAARAPEASSLVVNLLLADSSLHIFKDHNFDSCTMCVCNAAPKEVGNIRGADMYLPEAGGVFSTSPDDDPIRCTCGFSAIMNRRLSHRAGLFYEDEVEITGPAFIDDTVDRRKTSLLVVSASAGRKRCKELETAESAGMKDTASGNPNSPPSSVDLLPQAVLELIREQCVFIRSSANALCKAASKAVASSDNQKWTLNVLEFADGNEVASLALEQGRQAATQDGLPPCKMAVEDARRSVGLHRWQFLRAGGPHCNQDIVRVMRHLQPLLQEAVQKKCTTRLWDAPYTVNGPLTWRQFHRLAGRGTEDRCEPQPVPSLVVGHDKDWLSLSPYALQNWEKLLLEPYSYTRDVAYIVVAPDNEYILSRTRSFFKELSATYEVCRLGRHCPITKVLRDGILRVGKTAAVKLAKEPVDEWFNLLTEGPTTNMLKLYAQVCRHHLAPHLTQIPMDKSLLDSNDASQSRGANMERPAPSPMPPPSTPDSNNSQSSISDRQPTTPKTDQHDGDGNHSRDSGICGMGGESMLDDEDQEPPAIVVYLVEPFSLGAEMTDVQRLACLGLLRCFTAMLATIPEHVRSNLNVQIVSLETILELSRTKDRERHNDIVRSQALSVFSQCRRLLSHTSNVKSLTGFGPAAMGDLFLKSKDEKNRAPYRLYIPPYILAPTRDRAESLSEGQQEHTSVLYCNYCLSEDQRFLLAACTDEHGEIFETVCISIEIPNRTRRKKASARRVGLQKLMDFILGVMSRSVQPWRLVVGRIGRIGHGELKGWSWLLSRKALLKASKHLKEICSQCSLLYPNDVPSILSACLVSLEPDSALRLMTDQFTPDERFSSTSIKCGLSTPQDVSCTHILVFPTSATSRSSQSAFQEHNSNGPELGDDDLLVALNDDMDGMDQDLNELLSGCGWADNGQGMQSPTGSPRRDSVSQPGSPAGMGNSGQQSPFPCNANSMGSGGLGSEMQEDVGAVLQQPLALGYYVSTASTGRMPAWFWASCPHLEGVCPAFLKHALHLHSSSIQQSSDDLLQQQSAVTVHPLDSHFTTDVLRYVLEGYNALSWLALDSNSKDRLSCLPVHVQALMQLYHTFSALV